MRYKPGPKLQKYINSIDLEYPFHPDSYLFPFLNWDDFLALGKDISKNGLKVQIDLLKGEIIDGRHRYLACVMFGVVPKFKDLPEDTDPLSHVVSMNAERRHLTKGQKINLGLEILKEERKKAKKRQEMTQFAGKDKNNNPVRNSSVVTKMGTTEKNTKKGKAHVRAGKKSGVNGKTLIKVEKIDAVAKNDKEIEIELNKIFTGEVSVEKVYRLIAPPKNMVNFRTKCSHLRVAPCSNCSGQIMACKSDLLKGKLLLRTKCPDPCLEFE